MSSFPRLHKWRSKRHLQSNHTRRSTAIRVRIMPSLGIMGHITMPPRQRSPTDGRANFYINNYGDLRSFQPLRATRIAFAFRQDGIFAELKSTVENDLSKAGLMLFMQLDQGAVLQKETGQDTPRIIRFLIGNPLIMKEMAKHVPDAGSYAPVTVLVDERADGVHLSYDRMASFLAPCGNRDALEVARNLDKRIQDLLRQAVA